MSLHKFLGLAPPPSKKQKTVETCREYKAEKRKRSFQSNWLNKFTWLTQNRQNVLQSFVSNMRRQTVSFFGSFQIHNKKKLKLLICSTKN
jgi:hypothetical protein